MKKAVWKLITIGFSLLFVYELYEFVQLSTLNLLDTPNWLNISNLVAGGFLLFSLFNYAYDKKLMPYYMFYISVLLNVILLLITHYYEYSLGGYQTGEMLFITIVNVFILGLISNVVLKYANDLK
ncbi:hypothetical protein [Thalassotalea piscium]|uniref:Uncharacterized protein n=1 Tax=Thalassotalea piscium TaxID=1230533 RepID=A0A7X0NFU2_9GAMM|nr:hypothetical protein [Thalassotalea piscium]MBB6542644.1 hypothetical protein [Thalassotalea piscium]